MDPFQSFSMYEYYTSLITAMSRPLAPYAPAWAGGTAHPLKYEQTCTQERALGRNRALKAMPGHVVTALRVHKHGADRAPRALLPPRCFSIGRFPPASARLQLARGFRDEGATKKAQ